MNTNRICFLLASIVICLTACSTHSPVLDWGREHETHHLHTVSHRGETLSEIAQWYTGRASNWRALRQINELDEPRRLKIGQVVAVPRSLLRRSEAPPRSYFTPRSSSRRVAAKSRTKTKTAGRSRKESAQGIEIASTTSVNGAEHDDARSLEEALKKEVLRDRLVSELVAEYDQKYQAEASERLE